LRRLFFLALLPLILWADAHIFVYHRFGDEQHNSTNTSIETLRSQFEYLKTNGYKVVPLQTIYHALSNNLPVSDQWVAFNIDDSYKSFYENGLPLFKEYEYPFTLFVYVEATDKHYGDFMTWEQIRDAQRYGEIGLHSYGHHHSISLSKERLETDTAQAISSFQKQLNNRPKYYAYPYGEYNINVRQIIESFDFDLILNQNSGAVSHMSDPYDLDRIALTGENLLVQKLQIKTLPTKWITPQIWPKNSVLKTIHAKILTEISSIEYFVSGQSWKRVKVENGEVNEAVNLKLTRSRTRLFLKYGKRQSSLILVRE